MFVNFFDFSEESMSFNQELVSDYRVTLSWIFLESIYKNRNKLSFQYNPDVGVKIMVTDQDIVKYNGCLSKKKLSSKRCSTINIDIDRDSMSRRILNSSSLVDLTMCSTPISRNPETSLFKTNKSNNAQESDGVIDIKCTDISESTNLSIDKSNLLTDGIDSIDGSLTIVVEEKNPTGLNETTLIESKDKESPILLPICTQTSESKNPRYRLDVLIQCIEKNLSVSEFDNSNDISNSSSHLLASQLNEIENSNSSSDIPKQSSIDGGNIHHHNIVKSTNDTPEKLNILLTMLKVIHRQFVSQTNKFCDSSLILDESHLTKSLILVSNYFSRLDGQHINHRPQEDCTEFMNFFLNRLFEFSTKSYKSETFEFKEISKTFCTQCKNLHFCRSVESIQLDIPLSDTIQDSLDKFLNDPNVLADYICMNCSSVGYSHEIRSISNMSPILILTLKRFEFIGGQSRKLKYKTRLNEMLTINNTFYTLRSVIFHTGENKENGHYYCICLCSHSDTDGNVHKEWYKFDDSNVSKVDFDHVKYKDELNESCYVTFYQRTDASLNDSGSCKGIIQDHVDIPCPLGIKNIGNTCYMNSVFQSIAFMYAHCIPTLDNSLLPNNLKSSLYFKIEHKDNNNVCNASTIVTDISSKVSGSFNILNDNNKSEQGDDFNATFHETNIKEQIGSMDNPQRCIKVTPVSKIVDGSLNVNLKDPFNNRKRKNSYQAEVVNEHQNYTNEKYPSELVVAMERSITESNNRVHNITQQNNVINGEGISSSNSVEVDNDMNILGEEDGITKVKSL